MFIAFLYHLREHGVAVSTTEWLSLIHALCLGYARADLASFYHLARALLVKNEATYDTYDRAFASFFRDVDAQFNLNDELLDWLSEPALPRELTEAERAALKAMDLASLREAFEERLREQTERHDGGSHWIGTGGTSPFGHSGTHPSGIRVGGSSRGRSAVQVASDRRFANLRADRVLDTRQIGAALRRLRRLARDGGLPELDIDESIDESARKGGEIELVFRPPRRNRIKLLLLMDVGGSMTPHAALCEQLFSAAHASTHFKSFEYYFFHNCVYEQVYTDIYRGEGPETETVLKRIDATWTVIMVGDAYMHPFELSQVGGAIDYRHNNARTGLQWLQAIRERCPRSVWLNPETPQIWNAPSIATIRSVFPMFPMTLDGIGAAVDFLRGARSGDAATQRTVVSRHA